MLGALKTTTHVLRYKLLNTRAETANIQELTCETWEKKRQQKKRHNSLLTTS